MKRIKEERIKTIAGGRVIQADILIPPNPEGIVIFSHFYQSEPAERRHRLIAEVLTKYNFVAVLFDLTPEGKNPGNDIAELKSYSAILDVFIEQLSRHPQISGKPIAILSSSTGLVPAMTSAINKNQIKVIVSRGPVPLIDTALSSSIDIPVLLVAGSKDTEGIKSNLKVYEDLSGIRDLKIINGASSNFIELGKLGEVAHLAANWYVQYLTLNKAIPA